MEIHSEGSQISFNNKGNVISLKSLNRVWVETESILWEATLQEPSTESTLGKKRIIKSAEQDPPEYVSSSNEKIVMRWNCLILDSERLDIQMEVSVQGASGEFEFNFKIQNNSKNWTVRKIRGPILETPKECSSRLLWPDELGAKYNVEDIDLLLSSYPCPLSMLWCALDAGDCGLYCGCHSRKAASVDILADGSRKKGLLDLSYAQYLFCSPGQSAIAEPVFVSPYEGKWHWAAKRYRRWIDQSGMNIVKVPSAVKEINGWQLAIMKQQNGEIIWNYKDIDVLIKLAQKNGLNAIGLYGWTKGGHDRHYPVYEADPDMGGEELLKSQIKKARDAGISVFLYYNGQLLDMQTAWFAENGYRIGAKSERGEIYSESWMKYLDAPRKPTAYACQSGPEWREMLLSFAKQGHALGASGIIYDQIGSPRPKFCFDEVHGHSNPAEATGQGIMANLEFIHKEMDEIDPGFIIMTEHVTDRINAYIDFIHGSGCGSSPGEKIFPEMFRYTFPEYSFTQRVKTPVMSRNDANWACLYGLRHELEYRYLPDRLVVEFDKAPEFYDYETVSEKPSVNYMKAMNIKDAYKYLKEIVEFEDRNSDLFRSGLFMDETMFRNGNQKIRAKSFLAPSGDLGILLWNPQINSEKVEIFVDGYDFVSSDSPEGNGLDSVKKLDAEKIALMRFKK